MVGRHEAFAGVVLCWTVVLVGTCACGGLLFRYFCQPANKLDYSIGLKVAIIWGNSALANHDV